MRARFPDWCDLHSESYLSATDSEHDPLSFGDDSVYTLCHGENTINLFILAKTYDIPLLRHDAIEGLVQCFHYTSTPEHGDSTWGFSADIVQRAYDHTAAGSPLRRALATGYCLDSKVSEDSRNVDYMPRDFLADVVKGYSGLMRKHGVGDTSAELVRKLDPCEYHEHETKEQRICCKNNQSRIEDAEDEFDGYHHMVG